VAGLKSQFYDFAAYNGALDILKKLDESYIGSTLAIDFAAKRGQLNVIKYLHEGKRAQQENGVKTGCSERAFVFAAMYGHLGIVKYLYRQCAVTSDFIAKALRRAKKHDDVVKFLEHLHPREQSVSDTGKGFDYLKYILDVKRINCLTGYYT
jgi:hypothetical protein